MKISDIFYSRKKINQLVAATCICALLLSSFGIAQKSEARITPKGLAITGVALGAAALGTAAYNTYQIRRDRRESEYYYDDDHYYYEQQPRQAQYYDQYNGYDNDYYYDDGEYYYYDY
ncbi:MAG: hypothetical protein ACK481_04720 [Candidatus Melainabacteria bacterium]|jgi:hypothetical protein